MSVKHAMILAAGLGTRMKPLTLKTPKPLLKVGSKNLLERSINLLENHGVEQITINVHHLADQIEKFILNLKSKVKITRTVRVAPEPSKSYVCFKPPPRGGGGLGSPGLRS